MKKRIRKLYSVFLAAVILIAVSASFAAPAYAGGGDGPEIKWMSSNMWVDPGTVAYAEIDLDRAADHVELYTWVSASSEWKWFKTCDDLGEAGIKWLGKIDPESLTEDYITLKFMVYYDGGYMDLENRSFTIEWTDYYGMDRIAGNNRFETAFDIAYWKRKISGGIMSKYGNVIIACGNDFADALGGAYLAECFNAPILLVNNNPAVMDQVVMEIMNNLAEGGKIFILGGEGAISGKMEERLAAGGFAKSQIERFAGKNRYETNMKILEYCDVYRSDILVCSGLDFPDALSASAVGLPILLVGKSLSEADLDNIGSMKPSGFIIIGGTGAVSATVEAQLKARVGDEKVKRLLGANRYETSREVARYFFAGTQQRYYVTLACGTDFPDGLAGGSLCLTLRPGAPLILADNAHYTQAKLAASLVEARHAFVLGGPTLISDGTAMSILDYSGK